MVSLKHRNVERDNVYFLNNIILSKRIKVFASTKIESRIFVSEIQKLVFIHPFRIEKLYFALLPEDLEFYAQAIIRIIPLPLFRVVFRNIYLDMFVSVNPSSFIKSKFKIRFVIAKLWGNFQIFFFFTKHTWA